MSFCSSVWHTSQFDRAFLSRSAIAEEKASHFCHRRGEVSHIQFSWAVSAFWNNYWVVVMSVRLEIVCHVAFWWLTWKSDLNQKFSPTSKKWITCCRTQTFLQIYTISVTSSIRMWLKCNLTLKLTLHSVLATPGPFIKLLCELYYCFLRRLIFAWRATVASCNHNSIIMIILQKQR